MAHTNRGMSNQPMPGTRSLWTVTTKFMPVKIELNPRMNAARTIAVTFPQFVVDEYGV